MQVQLEILHEYPYPIAKCYEKVLGAKDGHQRWDACRYLFEVTLKYLACMGLAQYLRGDRSVDQINVALSCLSRPSLGHWLNILRLVERVDAERSVSILPRKLSERSREFPRMTAAVNGVKAISESGKSSNIEVVSPFSFLESMVSYRNRTAGHGAPQPDHIRTMTPVIEAAVLELLEFCDVLRHQALVLVSEIRVERRDIVHSLYSLMGTAKVAMPDLVTTQDNALFGFDGALYVCSRDTDVPQLPLHPLVILARDEVYLLQEADPRRRVEYICHHTGEVYTADRVFEDFKQHMGQFFGPAPQATPAEPEKVYVAALKMSLIDGTIQDEERVLLENLREQFGLSEDKARDLEGQVQNEIGPLPPKPVQRGPKIRVSTETGQGPAKVGMRKLLFFPCASVRQGFWADLVSHLASLSHKKGFCFSMLAPDPDLDYDAAALTALVSALAQIAETLSPDVLVIAPPASSGFNDLFVRWQEQASVPLMSVDTPFSNYKIFAEHGLPRPPLVQVDNRLGGRLAADIIAETMVSKSDAPRFLVLPGHMDAQHSKSRVEGFKERVSELFPAARCKVLPAGDFLRRKAAAVVESFFEDADPSGFHGFFCCNDAMALGAYDVLSRMSSATENSLRPSIVGFNGTQEFTQAMVADHLQLLAGTISQNLDEYVEAVLDVAIRRVEREAIEDSVLVPPTAIRRTRPSR